MTTLSEPFYKNSDWELDFEIQEEGSAVDITGKNFTMSLKESVQAPAVITFSTAAGTLSIDNGPAGLLKLLVNHADIDAANIPPGAYVWDLVEIVSLESRKRFTGGILRVEYGVS